MGNTVSTLTVASADPRVHGLFAYVPSGGSNPHAVILTNNTNTRSQFIFNDSPATPNMTYFAVNNPRFYGNGICTGDYVGAVNILEPQQSEFFYGTGTPPGNQNATRCYGNTNPQIISCLDTVNGQALNRFYTCNTGPGALLKVGTTVPNGCSALNLVWTRTSC